MLPAGSQLTLASLRHKFWILRAHATIRSVLYKCIPCTRERANVSIELMGDLPAARANHSLAPLSTGVDYIGSIAVRTTLGRGHKSQKTYIALFVCLTTLHLELINDYLFFINDLFFEDYWCPCILITELCFMVSRSRIVQCICEMQFAILTSETDSLQMELRGIFYFLRHRTSAIYGRPALKVLSII